jgi:hypothetical protein
MAEVCEIGPEDREKVVKYLRYTALSLDQICANVVGLARNLETAGFIPVHRSTKAHRDSQLRLRKARAVPNEAVVTELLEKVRGHAEPEAVVASLFRDLDVKRVKTISAKSAVNTDE